MRELNLLLFNKLQILKNCLINFSRQPLTKIIFIGMFVIAFLAGTFFAFWEGFDFLDSLENIGLIIIERLFSLFFMGIFFMLVFSNVIVSFSTIYRSEDLEVLFSWPIDFESVFAIKFIETIILSSWAFFFIIGPFIAAYGVFRDAGLEFYLLALVIFLPFLVLAASLGTIISMLVVRFFNRFRRQLIMVTVLLVAIFGAISYLKLSAGYHRIDSGGVFVINQLIPHFEFTQNPLFPNFWLVESLLAQIRYDPSAMVFFGLLLISNALFFFILALFFARKIYYPGWTDLEGPIRTKKFPLSSSPLEKIRPLFRFLKSADTALLIKDLKLFWRDPAQRSQFLIFFGLLAIYFGNLQNMSYHLLPSTWKNAVSFLNLFATCLVLASLCVRFIFPQLSLEARTFWILGPTPISIKRIIWGKFWLSLSISLVITESLIYLSNIMLKASAWMIISSMAIVFIACFALVGLSCGLGALCPNFKENNSAVIVSGFGGTLNLILALIYLGIVLSLLAIPLHLYFNKHIALSNLRFILTVSGASIVIISLITASLPLWLGIRNFQNAEF